MGLTAGGYLNELIRRSREDHVSDVARFEAEEKRARERFAELYKKALEDWKKDLGVKDHE